jgi:lipopolysaccharide transport system permease protein
MNPHTRPASGPLAPLRSLRDHRDLLFELAWREIVGRYRGSWLGLLWAVFNPLALLLIYTFVFGVVMKVRWGAAGSESPATFALVLFVGLMIQNLFSECVGKAPGLILKHATYVKKVVFPLEILPVISLLAALFHLGVGLAVFLVAALAVAGSIPLTACLFPLTLLPAALFTLGLSWWLASLGAYVRDLGQAVSLLVILFLFLSPVFYPVSALPSHFQTLIELNPLTLPIETGRQVLLQGVAPPWGRLALSCLLTGIVAWLGFWWFQKTRQGFSDVV